MRGMQIRSKFLFRTTMVLLGLMLAVTAFVAINRNQRANALSGPPGSEWEKVRGYIDSYIGSQYAKGADGIAGTSDDPDQGEDGFLIDRTGLKSRIDSNGDMNPSTGAGVLGEGDDAADAPVLVDNLNQADVIPGTSIQCSWNTGLGSTNCFDGGPNGKLTKIKAKVDAHQAAGFSTDVVFYCLTGHTEAPTTGGMGPIAQAGGLASDGSVPKVYAFKWGRNGWAGSAGSYSNTASIGASDDPDPNMPYSDASNANVCNGRTPDAELVRCTAQWAIYNGSGPWGNGGSNIPGGNVGNGQYPTGLNPNLDLAAGQIVDIRTPSPANTINDPNTDVNQITVNTIFNTGRSRLNSTLAPGATGILIAARTQMMGGIVAEGLKMLGYPMATNGFLNSGMPKWNMNMDERQVAASPAYSLVKPATIDNTAPAISNITALGGPAGSGSAKITWQTNEPATSVVEYSTTQGGPYTGMTSGCDKNGNPENCTVLRGSHSLTLTGLSDGTTYYYRVISYDGQANGGTPSAEGSFYMPCNDEQLSLSSSLGNVRWASPVDYVNRLISVDVNVANDGITSTAYDVRITGSTATQGVTLNTAVPVLMGNIPPGPPVVQTLKYQLPVNPLIPVMVSGFDATVDITAKTECGTSYNYQAQGYVEVPLLP